MCHRAHHSECRTATHHLVLDTTFGIGWGSSSPHYSLPAGTACWLQLYCRGRLLISGQRDAWRDESVQLYGNETKRVMYNNVVFLALKLEYPHIRVGLAISKYWNRARRGTVTVPPLRRHVWAVGVPEHLRSSSSSKVDAHTTLRAVSAIPAPRASCNRKQQTRTSDAYVQQCERTATHTVWCQTKGSILQFCLALDAHKTPRITPPKL